MVKNLLMLIIIAFWVGSCYHAQIFTEAEPSNKVIDKPWAHSFVFGLVPPDEIQTASECPNGVAKVETKISFLNGLVSAITFQLYTPMHITVTCATGEGMSELQRNSEQRLSVEANRSAEQVIQSIQEASERTVKLQKPVYISFK